MKVGEIDFSKYAGKFTQEYPPFCSKTVNGIQLHNLSRAGDLPDEMPTKEVEIYSIEKIGGRTISSRELFEFIELRIKKVTGDFRQREIIQAWRGVLMSSKEKVATYWPIIKIRVKCSSGTYMRSLAHKAGEDLKVGALALSIERTRIL